MNIYTRPTYHDLMTANITASQELARHLTIYATRPGEAERPIWSTSFGSNPGDKSDDARLAAFFQAHHLRETGKFQTVEIREETEKPELSPTRPCPSHPEHKMVNCNTHGPHCPRGMDNVFGVPCVVVEV